MVGDDNREACTARVWGRLLRLMFVQFKKN